MAEQKLDVKVTESGTAVVTSELDKLTAQLAGIEKAQEKETAATEKATAATERQASALEGLLKKTEGKFAIFDRIAGVMGKVNLALDLVNKAYEFGKRVVEDYILKMQSLEPALAGVNKQLTIQSGILDGMIKTRNKFALAGATAGEAAAAAGLEGTATVAEERARELLAERERAIARQNSPVVIEEEKQSNLAKSAFQGKMRRVPVEAIIEAVDAAATRSVEAIDAEYAKAQAAGKAAREALDALDVAIKKRNADPSSGKDKPARGGGKGAEKDILADLPDLRSEWLEKLGLGGPSEGDGLSEGPDLFSMFGSGVDSLVDSLSAAMGPLQDYLAEVAKVAAAYEQAADRTTDFAAATGKAALSAAVAAVFAGKSIAEGVSIALEAKAQEATVEALWWGVKALVFSITAPQFVGPALASAAGFAAVAAAAGVGSVALGGGGGGGGGSSAGASAPSNADFGPRRERDTGGGQTIVNVYNDGLTLSTENDIGRAVAGSLRAVARSPGSQSGAIQINTGGSRRR